MMRIAKLIERVVRPFYWLPKVIMSASNKFYWDDCFSRASSLAYTTLLALVPITALMFAIFRGFEIDDRQLEAIFDNILPPSVHQPVETPEVYGPLPQPANNDVIATLKQEVITKLRELGTGVRALSTVSLAVVIFTGLALLNTIESALNAVWKVTSSITIVAKVLNFWGVITLGPLMIAISFYWHSRFMELTSGELSWHPDTTLIGNHLVPIAAIWAALTLLYYKLPSARVSLKDAALGAVIAAIAFECTKIAFAYYISNTTTYSAFYGVLVTIPVFLFWLYLVWIVVLFGAEICYQAGSIDILSGLSKYRSELGEVGAILGFRILVSIGSSFVKGTRPPSESEITLDVGADPVLVRTCLGILTDAGLITVADPEKHTRTLICAPETVTVGKVIEAFYVPGSSTQDGSTQQSLVGKDSFLEVFRETAAAKSEEKSIYNWTLSEFLHSRDRLGSVE